MKIKFSCVLDYNPLMGVQSYIWLSSLLNNNILPSNIYMHYIGEIPDEYLVYLKKKQVNLIQVKPFDYRNKYCNKLTQLDTFCNIDDYDYVFLMDCDTAIISLDGIKLEDDIYAKIVDYPNPPIDILKEIYKKNNLDFYSFESTFTNNGDSQTVSNNCNGGVYIISKKFLRSLAPIWKEKSSWCIENSDLFTNKYSKHADQVGFALAASFLKKEVNKIGIEWNYPLHVSKINIQVSPKIIHFHNKIDCQIKLEKTDNQIVNNQIELINKYITSAIREEYINSVFWDFRYKYFPELGSGIGSRGEVLNYKRELLERCFENSEKYAIIDVGCGDLEVIKDFKFKKYLGLDLSYEVLEQGKLKKPQWEFKLIKNSTFCIEKTDFVVCLDVLIHQKNYESYITLITTLIKHTKKRLIIAAYNEEPKLISDITFFYEPLSFTLSNLGDFKNIYKIGEYRSTAVFVADKLNCDLKKVEPISFEDYKRPNNFLRKLFKFLSK